MIDIIFLYISGEFEKEEFYLIRQEPEIGSYNNSLKYLYMI